MPVTLKNIQMWSPKAQAIVEWGISREQEKNEFDPNIIHEFYAIRYQGEVHRFSPNITDSELERFAKEINEEGK